MAATETLLVNGKIFQASGPSRLDQQASFATSILVGADGTIKHINQQESDDEITTQARRDGAKVHDLAGRIVLPGFFDGHLHLLLLGMSLQKVDLEPCKNLEDIRATVRSWAQAHPEAPRIMCKSWMHSMTPGGVTHAMLDDLDPRPIFIDTKDLHSTWANQAGIDELDAGLGISTMADPPGGTIFRDADGKPTGLFEEAVVFTLIWPWLSRISTLEERAAAIGRAVDTYSAAGYVGAIDMAMNDESWDSLLLLRKQRPNLPLRVAAYWLLRPSDPADISAQVDRAIDMARRYSSTTSPDLRIVGVKIVSDGIVDACTAALSEPYFPTDTSNHPDPVWTPEMLLPAVRRATEAGLQVAIHAIGDLAITNAVDAIATAPIPASLRPRVEHLELASARDAARLGELGITASVQPVHADPAILRAWPRLLGEHRCGRAFAYREMADGGAPLAIGSDSPSAPHGVPGNLYVATSRRSAREPGVGAAVNAHFALGLCESVVGATLGSAKSCFMDCVTGSIEVGKKADLAVMDMSWDEEKLLEAKVVETWFGGRQVFDAGK